jgi:hypothetical protein
VTLGLIDTFRIGYDAGKTDSLNNVFGVDLNVDVDAATNVVAEVAMSTTQNDRSNAQYKTNMNGAAAHIGLNKETGFGDLKVALTHMDQAFDPGLANYKETRKDLFWSRHIHFKKPIELADSSGIGWEDVKPFRIGDGIDVGRNAFNFRLDSPEIFDGKVDNFIDYRYVRDSEHKYVEGVFREETTLRVNPEWTTKTLLIYHDLPKVKGGIDPILYSSDTGEFLKNTAVTEGADPSVSTYSLGVEYVPEEWISFFGIYENTNDSQFATGSHPNGLLNSTYFDTETIEGDVIRKEVPQLYSQGFFDLPPYDRFHVYKLGVSLKPYENLGIDIDFTKNDFKFAAGIDDNINHFGTTFSYKFNERLTGFLKYTFSKAYNLYRLTSSGDLKYEKHHNVFMEFNYDVTKDSFLTVQYGEGNVVSPVWGATANPYGESYPTLDTRHILRVYYTGEF